MTYKSITFIGVLMVLFFIACTKTPEPIDIDGDYRVTLFEINNCADTTLNRFYVSDSGFCFIDTFINAQRCLDSMIISFSNNIYNFDRTERTDNQESAIEDMGTYTLVDNNNFIFCNPNCDEAFIVIVDSIINVVRTDTLTRCGTLIRAERIF